MKAHHAISQAEQLSLFAKKAREITFIPAVGDLIAELCPTLLDGSSESARVLKSISAFLADNRCRRNAKLEREIPAELFTALFGVKTMLRNSNLNTIALKLEYNKQKFGNWLKDKITEGY